jgi:hypothetical protein
VQAKRIQNSTIVLLKLGESGGGEVQRTRIWDVLSKKAEEVVVCARAHVGGTNHIVNTERAK